MGQQEGSPDLEVAFRLASESPFICGIVVTYGAAHNFRGMFRKSLVYQCVGGPSTSEAAENKPIILTAQDALQAGGDCVAIQWNARAADAKQHIALLSNFVLDAHQLRLPVLLMLQGIGKLNKSQLLDALRIACEIGADLIKINLPNCHEQLTHSEIGFIKNLPPLLLAGGPRVSDEVIEVEVLRSIAIGFQGLCVGRQLLTSTNPMDLVKRLCQHYAN